MLGNNFLIHTSTVSVLRSGLIIKNNNFKLKRRYNRNTIGPNRPSSFPTVLEVTVGNVGDGEGRLGTKVSR